MATTIKILSFTLVLVGAISHSAHAQDSDSNNEGPAQGLVNDLADSIPGRVIETTTPDTVREAGDAARDLDRATSDSE